jgi:hypothetical protein
VSEHCNAPPSQCHAHHIDHWTNGENTDLDDLALLCHLHHTTIHHTTIHHTGRTLTRVGDHWVLTDTPDARHGGNATVSELFPRTG